MFILVQMSALDRTSLQSMPTKAASPSSGYQASSLGHPAGFIKEHRRDLQLVPTRDQGSFEDRRGPGNLDQGQAAEAGNHLPRSNRQNIATNIQDTHHHTKHSRSSIQKPFHQGQLSHKYVNSAAISKKPSSPYLANKNVKTQTSSAESSLLSEKSLLDTPLPRSKIPVPFSRYTPNEKASRNGKVAKKRLISRLSKNGTTFYCSPFFCQLYFLLSSRVELLCYSMHFSLINKHMWC